MLEEIRKIPTFMLRDFRILTTYKLAFSMSFLTIIFNVFYLILFGSMFGVTNLTVIESYSGGNFISYLLVGSMGWIFLWSIMGSTSTSLRSEMMMGTLESILLTKTRLTTMMLSYALFGSFFGFLTLLILVLIGFIFYGLNVLATANIFTLIIFIISSVMMLGFGMIFGGLTIWIKNIGGTVTLLQHIVLFFCGVYFPLDVLPEFLRPLANYIPFYYSIEGLRKSLDPATTIMEITYFILILLVLSIVFVTIGIFVLNRGLIKAKKEGSLVHY